MPICIPRSGGRRIFPTIAPTTELHIAKTNIPNKFPPGNDALPVIPHTAPYKRQPDRNTVIVFATRPWTGQRNA